MSANNNYLALDMGASSCRLHAGRLSQGKLELAELARVEHQAQRSSQGQLLWQLDMLLEWIVAELQKLDRGQTHYSSIGLDTWGVDYVLLDAAGKRLGKPYSYRDERTQGVYEKIGRFISREELYRRTGSQFMEPNTLCQLFAAGERESFTGLKRLLLMPSYLAYELCGRPGTFPAEATIASTTQMYSLEQQDWDRGLLQKLGFPAALCEALPAFAPIGTELAAKPAFAQGCLANCRVSQVASHDSASAMMAVPFTSEQGKLMISSGTWSVMGLERNQAITSPEALRENFANELGYGGSIRFGKALAGLWPVQQLRRERAAECSYGELEQLVLQQAEPFASLFPVSHPDLLRLGSMTAKIQQLCRQAQQPVPQTTAALLRSCYDSLALEYRCCLESLRRLSGETIEQIHIVGGGSQSRLLNQLCADMLGLPVETGPVEAAAIGNILAQILARNIAEFPHLSAGRQIVRRSFATRKFFPAASQPNALFSKYQQIARA